MEKLKELHCNLYKTLPREWAAVVLELKNLPSPKSPSLTTPDAVMNTFAGLMSEKWILLVFTKSVNSNFHAFWLAPITQNILGYSLFCDRGQDVVSFQDIFGRPNLSEKWNSKKKIPQKRRNFPCQCLLVGRKLFSCWICNKSLKNHLTKSRNVCKL